MIVRCEREGVSMRYKCYDEKGNLVDEIECEYEYDPQWDREDLPDCCWHCYNKDGYEVDPPWYYTEDYDEYEEYEDYGEYEEEL